MNKLLPKRTSKRKYPRYVRKDIKASITKLTFLGFKESINCKLLDISWEGAKLFTQKKLGIKSRPTVILKLQNNKELQLKAQVVCRLEINNYSSNHRYPTIKKIIQEKDSSLNTLHLFKSDKKIFAKYRDLNTTSVKTFTRTPLNKKKPHSLLFNLSNGEKHTIYTQVDSCKHFRHYSYGVKFENPSDLLGEYLVET